MLRPDIFELAQYATQKGLVATLGTNGTLIDEAVARRLREVGVRTVAISIDSSTPKLHDDLRGVPGAWNRALEGVNSCLKNKVKVQFNVTMTKQNYNELDNILQMAEEMEVKSIHLFFLVPTGRGKDMKDLSPATYETLLRKVLTRQKGSVDVKPTCAPQFMRIAKELDLEMSRYGRGCIAGISYCRIMPEGSVTPCPYLPVKVGNIRIAPLKDIWANSPLLNSLRNFHNLKGKCGDCDYRSTCGGCRARAYGLVNYCSGACTSDKEQAGISDIFAEDPWCTYQPAVINQ